jgi:hypothetical protein
MHDSVVIPRLLTETKESNHCIHTLTSNNDVDMNSDAEPDESGMDTSYVEEHFDSTYQITTPFDNTDAKDNMLAVEPPCVNCLRCESHHHRLQIRTCSGIYHYIHVYVIKTCIY